MIPLAPEPLHQAALAHARAALSGAGDLPVPVAIVARKAPPPGVAPVALLATFTTPIIHVFPLWPGINRVGQRYPLSDYETPGARLLECRQWLVLVAQSAWACDDRTTNESCYVAPEVPEWVGGEDPRYQARAPVLGLQHTFPGGLRLDWHGTKVAVLRPGGVLLSHYAGFGFGWVE